MDICILETCPDAPSLNHRSVFNNCKLYFVTYRSYNPHALSYNKCQSWAFNRNDLYRKVPKLYQYYIFLDHDVEFNSLSGKPFIENYLDFLDLWHPAISQPYYIHSSQAGDHRSKFDEKRISEGWASGPGGFITHLFTCIHHSILDFIFPLPTQFGGFWDAASYINCLVVPLFGKNILVDYNTNIINTNSENYPQNINPALGIEKMNQVFNRMKPIFTEKIFSSKDIQTFKNHYTFLRETFIHPKRMNPLVDYLKITDFENYINKDKLEEFKYEEEIMSWFSENLMKWCSKKTSVFIETGTYQGNTAFLASKYFKKVFTVEQDKKIYKQARRYLRTLSNMRLWNSPSVESLAEMIEHAGSEKITFWLDSHPMQPRSYQQVNILGELDIIKEYSKHTNHIILIDDYPFIFNQAPGYPTVATVVRKLKQINPNYNIQFLPMKRYGSPDGEPAIIAATPEEIKITSQTLLDGNPFQVDELFDSNLHYMVKNIKEKTWSIAKKILRPIVFSILEQKTWIKKTSLRVLITQTLRYRAAAFGLALTKNEKKLIGFKNFHKDQRAFIIGNGRSLNLCDLTLLKNEITFGVNNIFLKEKEMGFFPTYYIVEDILLAEDRVNQINKYKSPIKFFGNYLRYCLSENSETIWINVIVDYNEYPGFPRFSLNSSRRLWVGGTVTYLCMQLAYYMGISEIYLIGFDHNYKIPNETIFIEDKMDELLSRSNDPNHFHPNYFGKGFRFHDPKPKRMEKAYKRAKIIFEADDRKIYNATVGGELEIFDRVNYNELFIKNSKVTY